VVQVVVQVVVQAAVGFCSTHMYAFSKNPNQSECQMNENISKTQRTTKKIKRNPLREAN